MRHRTLIAGGVPVKVVVILLVVVGGGAFAAAHFVGNARHSQGSAKEAPKQEKQDESQDEKGGAESEDPGQVVDLGEFLVNIHAADGSLRYLKTEISLVVRGGPQPDKQDKGHKEASGEPSEGKLPAPSQRYARDVAISVLSSLTFETLRTEAGKQQLKSTLQHRLDAALEDYRVADILFTAFVMQ